MKKNRWVYTVTFLAFVITIIFSTISNVLLSNTGLILSSLIMLLFIFVGVIFDMIGIAVTSTDDSSFHAMASKKVSSAKLAIKLIKNSAKVSSFCNDVIGDICNIMSGTAGVVLSEIISKTYKLDNTLVLLIITSVVAALTIGGKALGKDIAIKNSEKIVFTFANILNTSNKK